MRSKGQDREVGAPLSWRKLVPTVQHSQPLQARLRAQVPVRSGGSPLTAPSPAQRPLHFPTRSPSPSISHKTSAIPGALPGQGRVSGSSLGPGNKGGRGPSAEWALSLHPQTCTENCAFTASHPQTQPPEGGREQRLRLLRAPDPELADRPPRVLAPRFLFKLNVFTCFIKTRNQNRNRKVLPEIESPSLLS